LKTVCCLFWCQRTVMQPAVQGSGFRVQGSGIRSWFRVQGLGFRVQAWCSLLLARLLLARFGVHTTFLVLHVTRRAMCAQRSCSSDEGRGRGDGQAADAHARGRRLLTGGLGDSSAMTMSAGEVF
jgi:hypothetical protein